MRLLVIAFLLACAAPARAADLVVYDDALRNGFEDYSYGDGAVHDFGDTGTVHGGLRSIRFVGADYGAVSFFRAQTLSIADYPTLRLWVHGGAVGGQALTLFLQDTTVEPDVLRAVSLNAFIPGGAPQAGAWRQVDVPLDAAPLADIGRFNRLDIQIDAEAVQPAMYFDDVALLDGTGSGTAEPVFDDGFEGGGAPPLQIERDVIVDGIASDRFTWRDATLQPRVAVLAHNDQPAFNGSRGGALREFRYQVGGSTRVARTTQGGNGGARGFGYVVSHRREYTNGLPGNTDDSPLGANFPGTFTRVFEGRHHAIFRFTQNYPRYSRTGANPPNTQYMVPVTVEWMLATGRDHPLWSVTWDLSGVPVDALDDDSRAPYGELLFDGSAEDDDHGAIAGVAWGDRYRFTTTSAPVTLDSAWTWNTLNTVPFVKLWTTARDATMGLVSTRTLDQQDAGGGRIPGYIDQRDFWGKTSAQGPAGDGYVMPNNNEWPYQTIEFSLVGDSTTNNTRLTWGTQYGFLGQQNYQANNIIGVQNTQPGWPKKSYSVHVVLGTHSAAPVEALLADNAALQAMTLTAAVGSVAANGPAGVADASVVAYQPAGYDHVRSALAFVATGNALDANIAVGGGNTLHNPLIVVRNWTAANAPSSVRLGNATLVPDADYFASRRAGANELWITLDRDLVGAANRLRITN
ncbi:hypothetical protein [Chiayiivirga flava]|uniref:LamG domain-containing protein n=1 Tax=Chiayiivirga flava TaxID=659595 RepID=A0A7W8D7N1_9GAMM|nr:hypothetical protein [Chiayiivirga flava]MBB5208217.1 hypothetical protein [Chiayiivirga flava]